MKRKMVRTYISVRSNRMYCLPCDIWLYIDIEKDDDDDHFRCELCNSIVYPQTLSIVEKESLMSLIHSLPLPSDDDTDEKIYGEIEKALYNLDWYKPVYMTYQMCWYELFRSDLCDDQLEYPIRYFEHAMLSSQLL